MQSFFMQTMKTDQTVKMHKLIKSSFTHMSEGIFSHVAAEVSYSITKSNGG